MRRISTVEFIRNFGSHSDAALTEPVIITKNGRDRLALISIEQYNLLQHAFDALEDARPKSRRAPVRRSQGKTALRRKA